ncbi:MAG: hypothetical protein GVY25_02765 [Bacteroidetes bacterium]|nr:hypothetical protein [Bacteroidota bacterium]
MIGPRISFVLVLILSFLVSPAAAQTALNLADDATLTLTGGIQPRVGLGIEGADDTERLGLGLRRARLQFRLTLLDRVGMEYDVDTTPGDLRSVDLFAFYDVSETVQLRAGRLPPAQARGFIPTSYTRIDAVDRSPTDERWAAGTLGSSGRDISLDLTAELGRTEVQVTLHNGTGGFSRDTDNFRESGSASSVTRGTDDTALAMSASVHHGGPTGLSFGGFASGNARGNERTELGDVRRGYLSAGTHLYYGERPGSQPVRLKVEAVATQYESVDGFRQQSAGTGVFGAIRAFDHGEIFLRGDRFWQDVDEQGEMYGTFGASYSPGAAMGRDYRDLRITASYLVRRNADRDIGHLFKLQGQIVF